MKQLNIMSFFLLLFVRISTANDVVKITPDFSSNDLSGKLYYFIDSKTRAINPLLLNNFVPYSQKSLNLGLTERTAWIMFMCQSKCAYTKKLVLDLDLVYADNVNFYVIENGGILSKYENYSWKTKLKDRIIKTRYFAFPIDIKPNQTLKIIFSLRERNGFLYAPVTLFEKNWYDEQYTRFNILYSIPLIFIGIIAMITIILWLVMKEQVLIYYFLYQIGFLLNSLTSEGVMAHYFPAIFGFPIWYVYGVTISYSGYLLFTLKVMLINLKNSDFKLLKIIIYAFVGCSIFWCFFLSLLSFDKELSGVSSTLASISYLLIFAIAVLGLIKKVPNAKLYFFAILPVLLSALLIRITVFDFINFELNLGNFVTNDILYLMNYYAPLFEVILLGLGLFFFFRRERENLLMNLLNVQEQKIQTQETERRRLAQDLHDDLGGTLSAIKGRMSNEAVHLETIYLVEKAIEDLRLVSRNLMPPELANEGLVKAISHTIERLQNASKIEFTYIPFGKEIRLSEEKELNIYRIVAELLNNVVKHSKATKAIIQLIYYEKYLLISLEDNGIGININENTWGIGLKNINSRVEFMKAKIVTDSSIKGATFIIEVPYT